MWIGFFLLKGHLLLSCLAICLLRWINKQVDGVLTLRDWIDIQLNLGQYDVTGVTLLQLVSDTMSHWLISLKASNPSEQMCGALRFSCGGLFQPTKPATDMGWCLFMCLDIEDMHKECLFYLSFQGMLLNVALCACLHAEDLWMILRSPNLHYR